MHQRRSTSAPTRQAHVSSGAVALGHLLGAAAAPLRVTLLHERERTGGRFELQTMCEGDGLANITIIDRL
jgi:acetyl-CoA C-acetyltransferase